MGWKELDHVTIAGIEFQAGVFLHAGCTQGVCAGIAHIDMHTGCPICKIPTQKRLLVLFVADATHIVTHLLYMFCASTLRALNLC